MQRATAEQQQSQAEAAPRCWRSSRRNRGGRISRWPTAQVDNAQATLKNAQDQLAKQEQSYAIDAKSVSRDALDNARNAERMAATNLEVVAEAVQPHQGGRLGVRHRNQEKQYTALSKAYAASAALLAKYTIRAPTDGVVRSIQAAVGSYVSPQGAYDSYTRGMNPLIVMSTPDDNLQVRVYVDEILIHRLADPSKISAEMFIRGTEKHVPLTFTRIQPYVSPKIELSDERQERVDVRVLPVIFRFASPRSLQPLSGPIGGCLCQRKISPQRERFDAP